MALKRSRSLSYQLGVAFGLLLVAVLIRLFVDPMVSGHFPFITFFPALVAVAVLCNFWVTVGFVIASAVLGSLLWDASGTTAYYHLAGSALFILTSTVIVALAEGLKDAYSQIAAADGRLRTLNGELVHRIRNLFQIASAIVSQSVRVASNPEEVESAVLGRLSVLSAAQTNALAGAGDTPLDPLIEVTLGPLKPSPDRLLAAGPFVTLPAPAMTMLALVLHELGTNALKYGGWSNPMGIVEGVGRRPLERSQLNGLSATVHQSKRRKGSARGRISSVRRSRKRLSITGSNAMACDAGSNSRPPRSPARNHSVVWM